jgi:hypothetical protein
VIDASSDSFVLLFEGKSFDTSRPGLSQRLQGHKINLGIKSGRVDTAVPQQQGDIGNRSPLAQHLSGEGVAKQMGTVMRGINTGTFKSSGDNGRDSYGICKSSERSLHANENTAGGTSRSVFLKVISNGLSDIRRQWEQR